jgi:hypothetical protein
MELVHVRVASGSLELGWTLEGRKEVRIQFRSSVHSGSKLAEQAPEFLADLSQQMDVVGVADDGASVVTMIFPIVEFE